MKREKKQETVKKAEKAIADAKVAVVTDYRGMTVADMNKLRRKLREAGVEYHRRHLFESTCTIDGLTSGYQGEGAKTVLPATTTPAVPLARCRSSSRAQAPKSMAPSPCMGVTIATRLPEIMARDVTGAVWPEASPVPVHFRP